MLRYSTQYYTISSAVKRGTAWVTTSDRFPGVRVVKCTTCGTQGYCGFPRGVIKPVGLLITKPGTYDDIQATGAVLIVSEKFRQAVVAAKLTGLVFRQPQEIVMEGRGLKWSVARKNVISKARLCIAHCIGSGGSLAEHLKLRKKVDCAACGWKEWTVPRRLSVDLLQWDGSDFFRCEEYGVMFFTPRAAAVLQAAHLSNFTAVAMDDYL